MALEQISPGAAGQYISEMEVSAPTKNQALALLLGVLVYTGARIGAIAKLKLGDFQDHGEQRVLQFAKKGGKARQIPVRHDLEGWIKDYMESAGIEEDPAASPLFRPGRRKPRRLVKRFYTAHSMRQQITRRLKQAGFPTLISPHSFRVMVVRDLLGQNMLPKEVQYLVGHSDPSTTQIYDRRKQKVSRNLVERISV